MKNNTKGIKKLISQADTLAKSDEKEAAEAILSQLMDLEDCPAHLYSDVLSVYLYLNNFTQAKKVFEVVKTRVGKTTFDWNLAEVEKLEKTFLTESTTSLPDGDGATTFYRRRLFGKSGSFKRPVRINPVIFVKLDDKKVTVKKRFGNYSFDLSEISNAVFMSYYVPGHHGGIHRRLVRFSAVGRKFEFDFSGEHSLPDTCLSDFEKGNQLLVSLRSKIKFKNIGDPRIKIFGLPVSNIVWFAIAIICLIVFKKR